MLLTVRRGAVALCVLPLLFGAVPPASARPSEVMTVGRGEVRPAAASADRNAAWSLTAAYQYTHPFPSMTALGEVIRATFAVPDGVDQANYRVSHDGRAHRWGVASVSDGYVVLDLVPYTRLDKTLDPGTVTFTDGENGPTLFETAINPVRPATDTTLTIDKQPTKAIVGKQYLVSGILMSDGSPVVGHYVSLSDFIVEPCTTESDTCGSSYEILGGALTDLDGHWVARVPFRWTAEGFSATYCYWAAGCWNNARSPGYRSGSRVAAMWGPRIAQPGIVKPATKSSFTVRVAGAPDGLVVKLQQLHAGSWVNISRGRVDGTTGKTVITAKLMQTGRRASLRAVASEYTWNIGRDEHVTLSGTSPVSRVKLR